MTVAPSAPARAPRPIRVAEVVGVARLSPRMVRVVLGGPGLAGFTPGAFTDRYVKLQIPPPGATYRAPFDAEELRRRLPAEQWPRTRTYTIADWDADLGRLGIEVLDHGGQGVGGPWAATARPGDVIQLQGPGGAYAPDPAADWHLMVGDACVVPAIACSLARVPAGVPVYVVAEVDGPGEERELRTPGALHLVWIHPVASARSPGHEVVAAVRRLGLPAGRGHCFVHGEAAMVREVRRHLVVERAIAPAALSASGYWKRGRSDEGWREDKPTWKRLVAADLPGGAGPQP